jgi:hypothetical protein
MNSTSNKQTNVQKLHKLALKINFTMQQHINVFQKVVFVK